MALKFSHRRPLDRRRLTVANIAYARERIVIPSSDRRVEYAALGGRRKSDTVTIILFLVILAFVFGCAIYARPGSRGDSSINSLRINGGPALTGDVRIQIDGSVEVKRNGDVTTVIVKGK
jgi:hypothetical protein